MILVYLGRWSYGRFKYDNNIFYKMKTDLTTGTWQDDIWCPIIIILLCTSDKRWQWTDDVFLLERYQFQFPQPHELFHENAVAGDSELVCPHKVKSVDLSAVNLSILLDFQTPELIDQQINRFALFVSPQELSICQSLDLISMISDNNSGIFIFRFCTSLRDRDGSTFLPTSVHGLLCFTLF
jgi:hypothetical protein